MNKIFHEELKKKIQVAIEMGLLIDKKYEEIEFEMLRNGQALSIQIWSSRARLDSTIIPIPTEIQYKFIFKNTAKYLKNNYP
jgi:hypothetical protein